MKNQNSTSFNDFISFRKFISLSFIQVIYVLGAIAITIAGIVFLVQAVDSRNAGELTLSGLGLLIIGNLLWRVICEAWILFFRLASSVGNIENQVKNLANASGQPFGTHDLTHNQPVFNQPQVGSQAKSDAWKCPKCQAVNPGSTYKCDTCGYSLV